MKKLLFILLAGFAFNGMAQSDPKALEIIQKSIEASGGKEKLSGIKSMIRKMEVSLPFGTSESESYYKNGKMYMKSTMQGNVVMEQKYDGSRAYMGGMQGSQVIDDEKMVKRMAEQAKIFPQLSILESQAVLTYGGASKIDGKDVHLVISKDTEGNESKLYFNAESGLMTRMVSTGEMQGTKVETTIDLKDYKSVDGILFAYGMSLNNGQFQMQMKITDIKLNPEIADSMFFIN